jgi:hypothetical protein
MRKKVTSKSSTKKFELKLSLVGQLRKLFVTLSFSKTLRSQIENQVFNYREPLVYLSNSANL